MRSEKILRINFFPRRWEPIRMLDPRLHGGEEEGGEMLDPRLHGGKKREGGFVEEIKRRIRPVNREK